MKKINNLFKLQIGIGMSLSVHVLVHYSTHTHAHAHAQTHTQIFFHTYVRIQVHIFFLLSGVGWEIRSGPESGLGNAFPSPEMSRGKQIIPTPSHILHVFGEDSLQEGRGFTDVEMHQQKLEQCRERLHRCRNGHQQGCRE